MGIQSYLTCNMTFNILCIDFNMMWLELLIQKAEPADLRRMCVVGFKMFSFLFFLFLGKKF